MVTGYVVFIEQRPFFKVFIPISEFHIEAAIHRLITHLTIKPFPICHGPLPFSRIGLILMLHLLTKPFFHTVC